MARYGYRTAAITAGGIGVRVQLLRGDSRRVSVNISHTGSGSFRVFDRNGTGIGNMIVDTTGSLVPLRMAFRDYGPMIQGEMWASQEGVGALDFIVATVFLISHCG